MNDVNDNLNRLAGSLTSAQGSLTMMQDSVIQVTQQVNEVLGRATAIEADVSVSAISMRDHIALLMAQWGVNPKWVVAKISAMQLQKDENGNYVRDAKGNFIVQ